MFTGRAIAKYLAAIAIGASAGGMLGYQFQHLSPQERVRLNLQAGKLAPAVDSRAALLFKPVTDVLP